ncbi:MAG: SUMF1/EgtB/PvdO family nonheme iron enzyme, partial [Victivallales bacterium]|nr:SUMF1/EgtB/PvdO family nonheme iron enzyme [Victivallales bacterium]
ALGLMLVLALSVLFVFSLRSDQGKVRASQGVSREERTPVRIPSNLVQSSQEEGKEGKKPSPNAEEADCTTKLRWWDAFLPRLSLQLPHEETRRIEQALARTRSLASRHQHPQALEELIRLRDSLQDLAVKSIPDLEESFASVGRMLGFLASPLGTECLPPKKRASLVSQANVLANKMAPYNSACLGKTFTFSLNTHLNMPFVPPGRFVSPSSGKACDIDYPYWIYEREVSNGQYHLVCGPHVPSRDTGNDMPVERMGWYDILRYCHALTRRLDALALLPPGYAIRPPTEEEWEFAALGGWANQMPPETKPDSKRMHSVLAPSPKNPLGICDMEGNAAEFVHITPTVETSERRLCHRGASVSSKTTGIKRHGLVQRDACNIPDVSFRPVLAPTDADYFRREFAIPALEIPIITQGERRIAALCTWRVSLDWEGTSALASAMHAHLVEPDSLDELARVYADTRVAPSMPCYLGVQWSDGAWRRTSDSCTSSLAGLTPPASPRRTVLEATPRGLSQATPEVKLPSTFFVWDSQDAWLRRAQAFTAEDSPLVLRRLQCRGRDFAVVKLSMPAYAIAPFCKMLGLQLAILSAQGMFEEMLEPLADLQRPIALGARKVLDAWCWDDGAPLLTKKKILAREYGSAASLASRALNILVLEGQELLDATASPCFLVELTTTTTDKR